MAAFVCSDLHGCLEFYDAVNKVIGPEDVVYFLGDAGDRGPQPWETIKAVLNNPQWIYLKGNHEDMLLKCLRMQKVAGTPRYNDLNLLASNGGLTTFNEAIEDPDWEKELAKLENLPVRAEYINKAGIQILLSHAGFTPWIGENGKIKWLWDEDLIWNREHFLDDWPDEPENENMLVVHGHTPIPYLTKMHIGSDKELEPGALWYDKNHKVDIDCGAVFTGYFVLLNLDTFDEYVFEASDKENN